MEDKKEKSTSTNNNCDKKIIESSLKPLKKLAFLHRDFFAFMVIMFKEYYNIHLYIRDRRFKYE